MFNSTQTNNNIRKSIYILSDASNILIDNIEPSQILNFTVAINYDGLLDEQKKKIFEDMCFITFIILSYVRDFIIKNITFFFEFDKYNYEIQQQILMDILQQINKLENTYCSISINDISYERPQIINCKPYEQI